MKYTIVLFLLSLVACTNSTIVDQAKVKLEILAVEKEFNEMASSEGIAEAFLFFADSNAVLNRNNVLIKGKEEIKKYLEGLHMQNIKLDWTPDFVDVAASGDLAYTYGKYKLSRRTENGEVVSDTGIFHTVWRKQANGSWKYVWD